MLFLSLGCHIGGSGPLFWLTLGCFFGAFSYLGSFLKIALPCRRELKNQGPGVTEIAQKSNKKCAGLWDCFGKPIFKDIIEFGLKHAQKVPQIGHLSWPGAPDELLIFTLGSTWLPKWCPMAPKVTPRVSKGCQNEAKMPPKVFKM